MTKAVILAGGLGTRLSEETSSRPKPMVMIGGKPILWHIMKMYEFHGVNDFIICLGYKGHVIKEYFSNYHIYNSDIEFDFSKNETKIISNRAEKWKVTLVDTGEKTMTGGRIKRIMPYVEDQDYFCLTYGDGVSDVNIKKVIDFHKKNKKLATVTAVQPEGRFGMLDTDNEVVKNFMEKPRGDGGYINGGFFVLNPKIFDYIENDLSIWERDPLVNITKDGELNAYKHDGFWKPMDTLRDKYFLSELWDKGNPPWKVWELKEFYKDKNVFVTGHSGFKGSWLCIFLSQLGAKITGYSLPPNSQPNLYNLSCIENSINSKTHDIRDYKALYDALHLCNPDVIFHLAAQPLVRYSYNNPIETYETNIMGTNNILHAAQDLKNIRAIINITTDKCYENNDLKKKYSEDDKLGGHDPYSSSKACSEIITSSYKKSYYEKLNIGVATARAGNVIGGGDFSEDRIIPDLIRSIINNKPIEIRNPSSTRPWQHVFDVLYGYLILGKNLYNNPQKFSKAYNFSPQEKNEVKVIDLIDSFIKSIGKGSYEINIDKNSPHESKFLQLNSNKAIKELKWNAKYDIESTVKASSFWYTNYISDKNIANVSSKQVSDYINLHNKGM